MACLVVCLILLWLVSSCDPGKGGCGQPFCLGKYSDLQKTASYLFCPEGKVTANLAGVTFEGTYRLEGEKIIICLEENYRQEATWEGDTLYLDVGADYPPYQLERENSVCKETEPSSKTGC